MNDFSGKTPFHRAICCIPFVRTTDGMLGWLVFTLGSGRGIVYEDGSKIVLHPSSLNGFEAVLGALAEWHTRDQTQFNGANAAKVKADTSV